MADRFGYAAAKKDTSCADCQTIMPIGTRIAFDNFNRTPKGFASITCIACCNKRMAAASIEPQSASSELQITIDAQIKRLDELIKKVDQLALKNSQLEARFNSFNPTLGKAQRPSQPNTSNEIPF